MKKPAFRFKDLAPLIRDAFDSWQDDRAPRMGAALAYYMALSMAPTVLILIALVGWAFGRQASASQFVPQVQDLVGHEGAEAIQTLIESARQSSRGVAATLLGLATVFFAASGVVGELRDAMNTIWRVPPESASSEINGVLRLVADRLLSFALVLACGIFLLVSLILNTWLFAAGKYLNAGVALPEDLIQITDWVVSFVGVTAMFAFIFKVLPRAPVRWSDVRAGAVGTSLLFVTGKLLLGVYLGKAGFANTYGAAGSLVVVLVWVYYSAQVLYLGAEFTRAYAHQFGSMYAPRHTHSGL